MWPKYLDSRQTGIALFALAAAVAGWWLILSLLPMPVQPSKKRISIDSHTVLVDVADTEALRERGLSGRSALREGEGMLFVFDEDATWGIWMKDMRFSIDILWADAKGEVVEVVEGAAPDSYPRVFSPHVPARYVVELPAGYVAQNGISQGSIVVVQ